MAHHPATKTPLWKAIMRALKGCDSGLVRHARELLKQWHEQGVDMRPQSLLHLICKDENARQLHSFICKKHGMFLLTLNYNLHLKG